MQTHPDNDANSPLIAKFRQQIEELEEQNDLRRIQAGLEAQQRLERLKARAEKAMATGCSSITAGDAPVAWGEFESGELCMTVRKLPDDPERVLRLSIGEMEGVARSAYCVFRGRRKDAVRLLKQAVWALEHVELSGRGD